MICIESILKRLEEQNISPEKLEEVKKAYQIAAEIHKDQYRQSGEPYIIHPLNVANNLLDMEVYDPNTISAALLHDTIEDAQIEFTKEDVASLINPDVAELVDGVTKMRRMNFSSNDAHRLANTRKIINGLTKDVRIILIKLADRLHNMQTLEFKKREKQKENALETIELFVPLSLTIGAYQIKNKLEDLSLMYLEPDEFKRISEQKENLREQAEEYLREISLKLEEMLNQRDIANEIIFRSQTVGSLYKKIKKGYKLENIYDLFYLKILVDEVENCYRTLCIVHKNNPPINGRFKDYIYNPKTNMYQSLHTTVSGREERLTKVKIRTFNMDKVAAFGVPAIWNIPGGKTKEETQRELREKCQFAKKLIELDASFRDNEAFIREISRQLLTDHVYPYTHSGETIELPAGSTVLDFAMQAYPELVDQMTGILVNGREVPLNYVIQTADRIQILTKGKINQTHFENPYRIPKQYQKTNGN